jgi:hypothetical protein
MDLDEFCIEFGCELRAVTMVVEVDEDGGGLWWWKLVMEVSYGGGSCGLWWLWRFVVVVRG